MTRRGLHPSQFGVRAHALSPPLYSLCRSIWWPSVENPLPSVALDQNQAHRCASRIKLFPPLIIGTILGCLQSLHTFPVFLNCLHYCSQVWRTMATSSSSPSLETQVCLHLLLSCYTSTSSAPSLKICSPFSPMKEVGGRKGWVVPRFHSLLFIRHLVFSLGRPSSKGFTNINSWVLWPVPGEVGMIAPIL